MKVQNSRIPNGHVLIVQNGKLIAVPAAGNHMIHAVHVAGVGTGELANAVATPFMMAWDAVKAVGNVVASSQYGQSTKYGWDKAEMRKATWSQGRQLKTVDPQHLRKMLVETVDPQHQGKFALVIMGMSDAQVRSELASRMTPNPYIDEAVTYAGVGEFEEQSAPQPQRTHNPEPRATIDPARIQGAFAPA